MSERIHPRIDELIRRGNRHPFGVGGLVYSPEFADWRGGRGEIARMFRASHADSMALLRRVRRRG